MVYTRRSVHDCTDRGVKSRPDLGRVFQLPVRCLVNRTRRLLPPPPPVYLLPYKLSRSIFLFSVDMSYKRARPALKLVYVFQNSRVGEAENTAIASYFTDDEVETASNDDASENELISHEMGVLVTTRTSSPS